MLRYINEYIIYLFLIIIIKLEPYRTCTYTKRTTKLEPYIAPTCTPICAISSTPHYRCTASDLNAPLSRYATPRVYESMA